MSLTLNKNCIDSEIGHYLAKLSEVKEPIRREANTQDSYRLLKFMKRHPLGAGPYPDVSFFETGNRIFSDLVILFGVRRLLCELGSQFPFTEYHAALGTEQGPDVEAREGSVSLAGEAFNVARTLFQWKKQDALEKVLRYDAEYKLLLFNSDVVVNPVDWDMKKEQGVCYLTIDVEYYLGELDL
ncbi:MAG: hypothetical protein DDT32_01883 [Syntrophomonadaceae bacterium]|nr:hypothetical protein [Bacillota bacterium]